jgi:hypothetical protein
VIDVTNFALLNTRPDQAVSVLFARESKPTAEKEEGEYAFFQVLVGHVLPAEEGSVYCTRVITRRLRLTATPQWFMASLDVKVCALLVCKQAVLAAADGGARAGARVVEEHLRALSASHGTRERLFDATRDGSGGVTAHLPPELLRIPQLLYHAWRGPLFNAGGGARQGGGKRRRRRRRQGAGGGEEEDRCECARMHFAGASVDDGVKMMCPELLLLDYHGHPQPLPTSSLCLAPSRVLFLDAFTSIVLWSGRSAELADTHAALLHSWRTYAQQLAATRLPAAVVLEVRESEAAAAEAEEARRGQAGKRARRSAVLRLEESMRARLEPAQNDASHLHAEVMHGLAPLEQQQLRQRLVPTPSLPSFLQFTSRVHR